MLELFLHQSVVSHTGYKMDIDYNYNYNYNDNDNDNDNFSLTPWSILNEETLWLVVVRGIFAEEFEIQFLLCSPTCD